MLLGRHLPNYSSLSVCWHVFFSSRMLVRNKSYCFALHNTKLALSNFASGVCRPRTSKKHLFFFGLLSLKRFLLKNFQLPLFRFKWIFCFFVTNSTVKRKVKEVRSSPRDILDAQILRQHACICTAVRSLTVLPYKMLFTVYFFFRTVPWIFSPLSAVVVVCSS